MSSNPPNDLLLTRLKEGEKDALKEIFHLYYSTLCRIAYRVVTDPDAAKDIVQDVFLKVWTLRSKLSVHTSLEAYLKRAVVNTSLNWLEARGSRFVRLNDPETVRYSGVAATFDQDHELAEAADKAINNLPGRTKAVFTLTRMEGMSYREVAAHLDISEKAVEKEMMKALKLLRIALGPYLSVLGLMLLKYF